jgi:hypothetical protein
LPGKDALKAAALRLAETANWKCSRLIQDSHGWCFYVRADDRRKYLVELLYVVMGAEASNWVVTCNRCVGMRAWEWLGSQKPNLGQEQQVLNRTVEILISQHGFERHAQSTN